MLNPKVAIVIPAYNEEAILQKTIDKMENLMKIAFFEDLLFIPSNS